MSIEKKEKLTVLQRTRRLILGREKPNLATRISVGIGFLIWVYHVSWQLLTLMAITLMGSLKQEELIRGAFQRVGSKLYYYENTIDRLTINTIVSLIAYGVSLLGLILIYRKKKIGFLVYILGNVSVILSTLIIMKLKYFQTEWNYTDLIMLGIPTLYFGFGALWFYKVKAKKAPAKAANNYEEA
ncbi:hypothetical protein K6119_00970 [Paracrocinitomix mangrovi]|uniref:hypothetical protein n=1 Tax=Paracrocinitomix mangrovi TaxID=2862509 RepID=UPI001C8D2EFA|nr:hypothetical protein [Paracrocinitomix mangrovi]UKN02086.1 hypothetical protein K6119_00970 [Paracrocinitomix mangrovi]